MLLLSGPKQQDSQFLPLVRAIIQSPQFTAGFHINSRAQQNILASAIVLANPQLIDLLLAHEEKIDVIFSGANLQYAIALDAFKHLSDQKDNMQIVLNKIRDFAIRHAIETDNPNIMQALEDVGAKPDASLSDGTYSIELAKPGSKVQTWLQKLGAQSMAALCGIAENMHAFTKILAERNTAAVDYCVGHAKISEREIGRLADITNRIATA